MRFSSRLFLVLGAVLCLAGMSAAVLLRQPVYIAYIGNPKVVTIEVKTKEGNLVGSGGLITKTGIILTCAHLFPKGYREIRVTLYNGRKYQAFLVQYHAKRDLATLVIAVPYTLPYFKLGGAVVRGQRVMAFGAPLGIPQTVTVGYVENIIERRRLFMHSAPTNPGNSGGPILNTRGEIVGVNQAVLLINPFAFASNLALAVDATEIRNFLGI